MGDCGYGRTLMTKGKIGGHHVAMKGEALQKGDPGRFSFIIPSILRRSAWSATGTAKSQKSLSRIAGSFFSALNKYLFHAQTSK